MDGEGLGTWMVRRGVLDREGLRRARQRQGVYGGSLDTAVLELQLSDEAAVTASLTEATGLPAPSPAWLETPTRNLSMLLDLASARRLGAQPVAREEDRLEVVTRHGAPLREIGAWAGALDLAVRCYIVPEVRFEALLSLVHGKPVPPRFAALLGRIVGRSRARRMAEPNAPAARAVAQPLVETGPLLRAQARPASESDPDLDITEDIPAPAARSQPAPAPARPQPAAVSARAEPAPAPVARMAPAAAAARAEPAPQPRAGCRPRPCLPVPSPPPPPWSGCRRAHRRW